MELIDSHGRKINYLRLSVTDRCNLRCSYCMPPEGVASVDHQEILSYEELLLIAQAAVSIGIEKIRITGGEPLVRKGITSFLAQLAALPGLKHLALTTNAVLLADQAEELRRVGVQRINISLDSLKPETFATITRGGDLNRVMNGISAAEKAGFPIKINMVVMRGVNDDEILDFAKLTLTKPYAVRFIEFMPTRKNPTWRDVTIPGDEILKKIADTYELNTVDRGNFAGPAKDFRISGAPGTLGFITPIYGHFCNDCNRIRVTATGTAKSCLFSDRTIDLKPPLRSGRTEQLEQALRTVVGIKPASHEVSTEGAAISHFAMSRVGG